ncbi:MAG TPA: hypothetical protein VFW92_06840 [Candidatus Limnocylindrales bacterium]|nr:hypothetical protein [Candidatus Limnocylindrales bacterium]
MPTLDFSALNLTSFLIVLVILAGVDTVVGIGKALADHTFRLDTVAAFLGSHVLSRILPLAAMALLGQGLPQFGLPAVAMAWALAAGGLAAYFAETVGSLRDTLQAPDTAVSGASEG